MINSMIPWIGGKRLMREFLIARFPPYYDKYVEVFGGAGWVLFAKKPERFEVYNDANSNLTNMFHVVKHKPMSFVKDAVCRQGHENGPARAQGHVNMVAEEEN